MTLKNYIWDFDGTLFDTYPVMLTALKQVMIKHQIHYDGDLAYFIKKYSIREFAKQYGTDALLDDYHQLETTLQTQVASYPEIPAILKQIIDTGGQHFILSHRDDKTYAYLGELSLLFTEIITSSNHFARKPDPESLIYLIDKYQLRLDQTVMVGDRPLDILAGKNAGIKTMLFDEAGFFLANELNADYTVTTWENFKNEY
ncbi:phosphatase [Lactococcus piscium]|uniref:Phosphatase n=1 Tax=Pseudolactococcus piscium TaxID=1364 RepID=A0A2A5RYC4_9LACT|nr:HAD-IA family hydrolase [Lactococcus piscium]PCS06180.1 phosphatase [Lactococcus piscium]